MTERYNLASQTQYSASGSGAIRVLVVDDDGVLVRALQRVLGLQGFEVDTALDGRAALNRLENNEYDVMLLDLRMGSMDGMEVYAMAQRGTPPATIIHSAHIDVRTAVVATRAGVQDVMQKPVPEELLGARIRELSAQRRASRQQSVPALGPATIEESLLKLVGATNSFVRQPFVIEGAMQGAAGAAAAIALLGMLFSLVRGRFDHELANLLGLTPSFLPWSVSIGFVVLGGLLGATTALVSLRRMGQV